ncbi:hypothetical protein O4J56_17965 [Nocardiopsis sp. RSe5-2]|uniref:Uncharacterized protein n=1 Tax=Nocardiopsis endophytica TaxID=3018445 RepID=A0ABT4U6G4_9ACTN|nr:hypothetical protein [Nocardiopsis endophytica]MDA2812535.1 hypothetical protein [Nocardiopsis endophytica]
MSPEAPSTARPPVRTVEPSAGGWTWRIPAPTPPGSALPAPAGEGPECPEGPVRFIAPSYEPPAGHPGSAPSPTGTEVFSGVRGHGSVADALRVPDPLPPEALTGLPEAVFRGIMERPRRPLSPSGDDPADIPSLWTAVQDFLDECEDAGVRQAASVRAHLGDAPPDPVFSAHGVHRALGLGRLVVAEQDGRPRYDGVDVLLPSAPAPLLLDTCRVLGELALTAQLFTAAGKASAPSLARLLRAFEALVSREGPFPADLLRRGTAVLMVDHARRLAAQAGLDARTAALEMAVVVALLTAPAPAHSTASPAAPA